MELSAIDKATLAAIYFEDGKGDCHTRASELLGVSRDEVKQMLYRHLYSNTFMRRMMESGQEDYKAGYKKGLERGRGR